MPHLLSKGALIAGLQCPKRLYLRVHSPDLGELDALLRSRIDQGHEVGLLARAAFPGGVLVEGDLDAALARTAELVRDPATSAIYEATFRHGDLLVRADVLERRPAGRWRLVEVKAATGVKAHYLWDLAVQWHVLTGAGLDLESAAVMHLDREYVFDGVRLDPGRLFAMADVTTEAARFAREIPRLASEQLVFLAGLEPPPVAPGPQCRNPYVCEFYARCNLPLPVDVANLPRLDDALRLDLLERGITRIQDLAAEEPLTLLQQRARAAIRSGQPWVGDALAEALDTLSYPLHFLDFETLSPAIPRFADMGPYDAIPFQWSLHVVRVPGADPEHHEFLAPSGGDPRAAFAASLASAVAASGSIVVYHEPFEGARLDELAACLPERAPALQQMRERLWDLLPVIRNHVYHPDFRGSFSLKRVLPALVPDLRYEGMEVAEGEMAGIVWEARGRAEAPEAERLAAALRAYCRQDTLAMVRLLGWLEGRARRPATRGSTP
ncbi:MAG: DUF2779 domain-containing protein [Candidatus Rokubacteria bacterium]|nr:DUF2779 domain-containing protein [Candidatus Rokubacteria bacterium]